MTTRAKFTAAAAATSLIVMSLLNVYFVRENSFGTILWSSEEAVFFVQNDLAGHHVSYLYYPWLCIKQYLGAVEQPDDERASLSILRATATGVERFSVGLPERAGPNRYTPIQGKIYASFPALAQPSSDPRDLFKWSGDHFEQATEDEWKSLGGTRQLTRDDFENRNGWSRRSFFADVRRRPFTMEVGNSLKIFVRDSAEEGSDSVSFAIEIEKPGKAPERIATFKTERRWVWPWEYHRIFR